MPKYLIEIDENNTERATRYLKNAGVEFDQRLNVTRESPARTGREAATLITGINRYLDELELEPKVPENADDFSIKQLTLLLELAETHFLWNARTGTVEEGRWSITGRSTWAETAEKYQDLFRTKDDSLEGLEKELARWVGDGTATETIALNTVHADSDVLTPPANADDVRNCVRLIQEIPPAEAGLRAAARKSPFWDEIRRAWEYLKEDVYEECGQQLQPKDNMPKTQALLAECTQKAHRRIITARQARRRLEIHREQDSEAAQQ